jgi:tetratricopeptide (TPR) repeat protein
MRLFPAVLTGLSLLSAASLARADTMVIGDGFAHSCAVRALSGESSTDLLATCDRALEFEILSRRDTAKTHVNRAVVRTRMNDYARALSDLDRAERLAGDIGETYVNRGVVLIMQKQYAEAVVEIDRGIALNVAQLDKAYYNRAIARERLSDLRGAYDDYRKASELSPEWEAPKADMARFSFTSPAR